VHAAGIGSTDLVMLAGKYRFAPQIPLVPGYEFAGTVDAIGASVTGIAMGDRVAALTVYGGFAEVLVREAEHFLPIRMAFRSRRGRGDPELRHRVEMIYRVFANGGRFR
jgi:NADPH:quinone reductase-like Zn-dependent oxidoreductase